MIDWKKIEMRPQGAGFLVYDGVADMLLLEAKINRTGLSAKDFQGYRSYTIVDLRSGLAVDRCGEAFLTDRVFAALERLTCESCHQEWGPVCDTCSYITGDKLFFLYRDLLRMGTADVDDRYHEKRTASLSEHGQRE